MMQQHITRLITYVFIAIVVIGVLYLTQKSPPVVPHGVYLAATQTTFPAQTPNAVTVYKTMPAVGHVIGTVNVSMKFDTISQATEQQVLDYAVQLAAQHGANGLVIQFFFASKQENIPQYIMSAQVIKT